MKPKLSELISYSDSFVDQIHRRGLDKGLLVEMARLDTMLLRWHSNPETVANGPNGEPCDRTTEGLLTRRRAATCGRFGELPRPARPCWIRRDR